MARGLHARGPLPLTMGPSARQRPPAGRRRVRSRNRLARSVYLRRAGTSWSPEACVSPPFEGRLPEVSAPGDLHGCRGSLTARSRHAAGFDTTVGVLPVLLLGAGLIAAVDRAGARRTAALVFALQREVAQSAHRTHRTGQRASIPSELDRHSRANSTPSWRTIKRWWSASAPTSATSPMRSRRPCRSMLTEARSEPDQSSVLKSSIRQARNHDVSRSTTTCAAPAPRPGPADSGERTPVVSEVIDELSPHPRAHLPARRCRDDRLGLRATNSAFAGERQDL